MLEFLNKMFENKGLQFTRIILQNVRLPEDIAKPLDQKAQYGSMNEYEKTKQEYEMRVLNDNKELEVIKQIKTQQRIQLNEDQSRQMAIVERDLRVIQGEGQKSVSEINEKTKAETLRIQAESELKAAEIRAQTQITQAKTLAEGEAEAKLTGVKALGECMKVKAETDNVAASKNAESVKIEGEGEAALKGVLGLRRLYQFLNKKLEVVTQMGLNPNLKIFGKSEDTNLAQMAAYTMVNHNNIIQ